MKTLRLIGIALLALCVNFTSCSSDDFEEQEEQKKYTITLACVGEILNVTQEPLTKTETANIYEITVYSNGAKYASGSFDTVENLTIDLLEGKTYSFKVSYTIDSGTMPTNEFNYKVETGDDSVYESYYYRRYDVYYGAYENYTPSANGSVEIYMKRMSFGLKLIAEDLTEGMSIKTKLKRYDYDSSTESPETLTYNSPECEKIYSFYGNNSWDRVYQGLDIAEVGLVNYYESAILEITAVRSDGREVYLGTHNIIVERNKKTCVSIKIGNSSSSNLSNGIVITTEKEEMTDGKQYEVDGDKGTITEIQ